MQGFIHLCRYNHKWIYILKIYPKLGLSSYQVMNLIVYFDGLVQERCNSSALAMDFHLSCTKPLISGYNATDGAILSNSYLRYSVNSHSLPGRAIYEVPLVISWKLNGFRMRDKHKYFCLKFPRISQMDIPELSFPQKHDLYTQKRRNIVYIVHWIICDCHMSDLFYQPTQA